MHPLEDWRRAASGQTQCMYRCRRGTYCLASPGSIEYQTYRLSVNKRLHEEENDLHLLRIVKIVLVILLQGSIQSILGAKVRYAA